VLELIQVGYRQGQGWALRDISLAIPAGQAVAVTGPNGSGKSLLLAICATLAPRFTGTVRINGEDARARPSLVRRFTGYVPEAVGIDPGMSVREDLEFFADAHGLTRHARQEAVGDLIERWGLRAVAGEALRSVSRGFRQRLGLARAWLHRPRLLLLDDPVSALDADAREIFRDELRRHLDGGGSALAASHGEDAAQWSHRIGVLSGGELRRVMDSSAAPDASVASVLPGIGRSR
jgi:ABC-2 type transport system ATP-binding protein